MKLNLTESQRDIVGALIQQATLQVLGMNFNQPEQDVLLLRQHAYLKGTMNGLTQVLNFDEAVDEQLKAQEEQMRAAEQQAQNPAPTETF